MRKEGACPCALKNGSMTKDGGKSILSFDHCKRLVSTSFFFEKNRGFFYGKSLVFSSYYKRMLWLK